MARQEEKKKRIEKCKNCNFNFLITTTDGSHRSSNTHTHTHELQARNEWMTNGRGHYTLSLGAIITAMAEWLWFMLVSVLYFMAEKCKIGHIISATLATIWYCGVCVWWAVCIEVYLWDFFSRLGSTTKAIPTLLRVTWIFFFFVVPNFFFFFGWYASVAYA